MTGDTAEATVAAVRAGDEATFGELVEPHRPELQVHCYRMLGSLEDSEDVVQETFLRAWRSRSTFEGRSSFRAWLYRIATNACLDALRQRPSVAAAQEGGARPLAEVPWLQPYPDRLLDGIAARDEDPEADLVAKETIELAFIAAIQLLPPRQRAVLISRDVLGRLRRRVLGAPSLRHHRRSQQAAGRRVLRQAGRGQRVPAVGARRPADRGRRRRGDRGLPARAAPRVARPSADDLRSSARPAMTFRLTARLNRRPE